MGLNPNAKSAVKISLSLSLIKH